MPVKGPFETIRYFTEKLAEAFERQGVQVRILEAVYSNPKEFLEKIFKDPPDCTLSFNGLLPDDQGRFFCEMIKLPHVACLTQSAVNFIPLVQSPLNILVCNNSYDCDFFKGLHFGNTLFMPNAADPNIEFADSQRIYDVVMFSKLVDYLEERDRWRQTKPPIVAQMLEDACELVLTDKKISVVQGLVQTVDDYMKGEVRFNPNDVDMIHSLIEMERYINGKNQVKLIGSLKDIRVNIFGSAPKTTSWKKFINDNPHVSIQDPVPFPQAIEILKQTKIILNCCVSAKSGGSETVVTGLAAGALAMTPENLYFEEFFRDGENIAYYHPGAWDKIEPKIKGYLESETTRSQVAMAGREEVMRTQTWDVRVKALIPELDSILEKIKTAK